MKVSLVATCCLALIFDTASSSWSAFSTVDSVKEIIHSKRVDFDAIDEHGNTILNHLVTLCTQSPGLNTNIAKGLSSIKTAYADNPTINVNIENKNGQTILDLAAAHQNTHILIPGLLLNKQFAKVNKAFNRVLEAKNPSYDVALKLIEQESFDGNARVDDKYPLQVAIKKLAFSIISVLLRRKDVDIDAKDSLGNTALHHLINFCSSQVVSDSVITTAIAILDEVFRLRPHVNVNIKNVYDQNILDLAAFNSKKGLYFIPFLLKKQFENANIVFYHLMKNLAPSKIILDLLNQTSFKGDLAVNFEYPLITTVKRLSLKIVVALKNRSDVNPNDMDGTRNTALHHLVAVCEKAGTSPKVITRANEIISEIYAQRPDIDVDLENNNGQTILDMAAASSCNTHHLIPVLLQKQFKKVNYAFYQVLKKMSSPNIATALMMQDSFAGDKSIKGEYPLDTAVKSLQLEVTRDLLRRTDVNVNAVNGEGDTAIHQLIKSCDGRDTPSIDIAKAIQIIEEIYSQCPTIDVNLTNNAKETILQVAAKSSNQAHLLIPALLANKQFSEVNTPFFFILKKKSCSAIALKLMLQKSFSGKRQVQGEYPSQTAMKYLSFECIVALLKRPDVNVDEIDDRGNTPLHYLVSSFRYYTTKNVIQATRIINELFMQRPKVNVNLRNIDGETSLDLASILSNESAMLIPALLASKQWENVNFAFYQVLKKGSEFYHVALDLMRQDSFKGNVLIDDEYPLTSAMKSFAPDLVELLLSRSKCR